MKARFPRPLPMPSASPSRPVDQAAHDNPAAGYVLAAIGALLAVLVAAAAQRWAGLTDLSMVFMLAVLVVASKTRTGPAVATAVLCFLAYNFFFIEPHYTFFIGSWRDVTTLALFFAAALLAGRLASRLAMQVAALRRAHRHALARQQLAQGLAAAASEGEVVKAADEILRRTLDAEVWIRLGARGLPEGAGEPLPASVLRRIDAIADGTTHAETIEEHGWWFLPLHAASEAPGVIGLKLPPHVRQLDREQRDLVRALSDDIAQALLRLRLVADLQAERVAGETERLRSALLSSVSHDLRTPLASIIGAAGSLDSYGDAMNQDDRHALLDTIRLEGERLDRYIQNLLDMTRLGHGTLTLTRDWIGVDELIGSAIARLHRYQPGTRFSVTIADDLAPLWVHPALLEQALFNVIENAAHFSPPDTPVAIRAQRTSERDMSIEVQDRGPGIPAPERERIFDMFYSVERGDRGRQGTGLGLAICRGMVGAHGGRVEAAAGDDGRGTVIRITLPLVEPPAGESA
jgi:two-component system sensor histidine kinase KdpD